MKISHRHRQALAAGNKAGKVLTELSQRNTFNRHLIGLTFLVHFNRVQELVLSLSL